MNKNQWGIYFIGLLVATLLALYLKFPQILWGFMVGYITGLVVTLFKD